MKLMKFPIIAGSAIISPAKNFYVNLENIYEIEGSVSSTPDCIIRFLSHGVSDDAATTVEGKITITFDGADDDEKVTNANKFADFFAGLVAELTDAQAINKHAVHTLIPSLADIHAKTGIVKTGGTGNDAIATIALT